MTYKETIRDMIWDAYFRGRQSERHDEDEDFERHCKFILDDLEKEYSPEKDAA